jgi:hypothetical protein
MKTSPSLRLVTLLMIVLIISAMGCGMPQVSTNIPFNEDSARSHILPIRQAVAYTQGFRTVRDSSFKGLSLKEAFGQAEAFNRDAIAVLLNQQDVSGGKAAGVRIYYGYDQQKKQIRMILVPYDSKGNDIINELVGNKVVSIPGISSAKAFTGNGQTIEEGQRCPVVCDNGVSGLNGN